MTEVENKYDHQSLETKWQERWEKNKLYRAESGSKQPKFYCLIEFPYPSADGLHVGHPRSYTAMDIFARKKRMEGYNVLFPIGFDAFGLPTENYAIKVKKNPAEITKTNIDRFRRQLKSLGLSFDWSREVVTTDPKYYKWTQWIFLQLYNAGLVYQKEIPVNWCPSCKIGLANEEVVNGKCERCGAETTKKNLKQWLFKITKYAQRLIDDLEQVDYLEKIKTQQINWIGRSKGALIKFQISPEPRASNPEQFLEVFTTRPDTLFGATYLVLSPEHELVTNSLSRIANRKEVEDYVKKSKSKSDLERTELSKEKTGVELKGTKAINPATKKEIPIWVADYVLMGYGTGAIMAVPAHDVRDFQFASKFNIKVTTVIEPEKKLEINPAQVFADTPFTKTIKGGKTFYSQGQGKMWNESEVRKKIIEGKLCYTGEGKMINSGEFNRMDSQTCIQKMTEWLAKEKLGKSAVNYKLRDWVFSRQHYWGEPIPLIHCKKCGVVPVPEKDLPVELPKVKKYEPTDTGESPLASIEEWVNTTCPQCGGKAKRETDTMPNWAGSNWYFIRYADPHNDKEFASQKNMKHWLPVDIYNGGMEHTTLHLLYSRFWYKALYDLKLVPGPEPYSKRISHGMVLAEDGKKMSKSLGNVINPDDVVKEYGADTMRVYEMFMGPFSEAISWDTKGIVGVRRFLDRVYKQIMKVKNLSNDNNEMSKIMTHLFTKSIVIGLENFRFNTCISDFMRWSNNWEKNEFIYQNEYETFLLLLSPFAPHLAEELWEKLGHKESIFKEKWPEYDPKLAKESEIEFVIQVNGKVRDKMKLSVDVSEEEAIRQAEQSEKIKKNISGKKVVKKIFVPGKLLNIVVK